MSLLDDLFGNKDTAAALGLLAGYGMAGRAPEGFLAATGHLADAKKRGLEETLLTARIDETKAQAAERMAKTKKEEEALARAQRIQSALPSLYQQPGMTGGEPVPQSEGGVTMFSRPMGAAPMRQTAGSFDVQRAIQLGMDPDTIQKYAGLQNIGVPEVARTVEVDDGRGGKMTMQLDKFGRPVGQGLPGYIPPVQVNQGDRVTFARPSAGATLPINQSPDSKASNALGWANNRLSQQRLSFDERQAMQPSIHDGQFIYKPTMNNPQGATVPIGGFQKPLGEAAKKQVTGIDALGGAIDEYVKELGNFGTLDIVNPDARAKIGTKYNNMMLQAKEAYNLGVLNGPDYQILTSIIADPTTAKGAIVSRDALKSQASELKRIMGDVRKAVTGQGGAQGPQPGAVQDGYRFKGGNPADPKNWEKV